VKNRDFVELIHLNSKQLRSPLRRGSRQVGFHLG